MPHGPVKWDLEHKLQAKRILRTHKRILLVNIQISSGQYIPEFHSSSVLECKLAIETVATNTQPPHIK